MPVDAKPIDANATHGLLLGIERHRSHEKLATGDLHHTVVHRSPRPKKALGRFTNDRTPA
jgi:hypothetical protein